MARSQTEQRAFDFVKAHPGGTWDAAAKEEWEEIEADWRAATGATEKLFANEQSLIASFAANPIRASRRVTSSGQPGARRENNQEIRRMGVIDHLDYCTLHGIAREELTDGGFGSFGEFLRILDSKSHDPRIAHMQSMMAAAGVDIGSKGGALVPDQFITESPHGPEVETEVMRPGADVRTMRSGTLYVSGLENFSQASGVTYGGFEIQVVPEGETFNLKTPVTSRVALNRNKIGVATDATMELVTDSDYERVLVPALNAAISYGRDYYFLRGTGSGQPMGAINAASTVSVAKEVGQSAASINYTNLSKMYARMHPQCEPRAVWLANPTTKPALMALSVAIGTAGQFVPVLSENGGGFTMFGRPVIFTSKLPALGTVGDIVFIDRSQYIIGEAPGLFVAASDDYAFLQNKRTWLAYTRVDGQPRWRTYFTPQNGDTLSWCVTLATRS